MSILATKLGYVNSDDDIPVEWPVWDQRTDTPMATPLADLFPEGVTDAAAMDAERMSYQAYLAVWDYEPEPAYFEDEV